jgi:hypothetical protein
MARRVEGIWVCIQEDLDARLTPLERKQFKKWMGGQTGIILDTGEFGYYLHDVERFIKLYRHGVKTYFN